VEDLKVGLFCHFSVWSDFSVPVHFVVPQLSWGLGLYQSCGVGLQLSWGSPRSRAGAAVWQSHGLFLGLFWSTTLSTVELGTAFAAELWIGSTVELGIVPAAELGTAPWQSHSLFLN
jgi:hypothetical protein